MMGKGFEMGKVVALKPAKVPLTPEEALAWIAKHGRVTKRAVELAEDFGWHERKTQRYIKKWRDDGLILKKGTAISVISPIATATATTDNADIATTRHQWVARFLITATVLSVVASLNAWPRLVQLWRGDIDSSGWPFLAFQLLSLFIMSQIPFAIRAHKRKLGLRVVLAGLACMLVVMNLAFSIESVGHVRDVARDRNRDVEDRVTMAKRQLDEAREQRAKLPDYHPTSDAEVASAQRSVDTATADKERECTKVGDVCRQRIAELVKAEDRLSQLQADKAAGDEAMTIGLKITKLEAQLRDAGPAPLAIDPGATRLAAMTFGLVTPNLVSEWLPTLMSLVAEILALLGPFVLSGAFAKVEGSG